MTEERRRELVQRWFEIDVRSLAALRIALGLLLIWDLGNRLFVVDAFLTDGGMVPRWVAETHHFTSGMWTLHGLSGEAPLQYALLTLALAVAGALLVGWQTRAATVLSWALLTSLHYRNYFVLNSGDDLLRILLVFGIFLPLGATWSVDSRGAERPPKTVCTLPSGLMLLQVCAVYWWVVIRRLDEPTWMSRGNAVYLALSLDAYATQLGIWVRDTLPFLLKPATWATMLFEGLGPFLAFSPWRTARLRTVTVFGFIAMHLTFGAMMEIGMFFAVSCASWLVFLPSEFWDRVLPRSIPTLEPRRHTDGSVIAAAVVLVLFALNIGTNLSMSTPRWFASRIPAQFGTAATIAGVAKEWKVYTPPPRQDGWLVLDATLASGEHIDPRTNAAPTFDRPADIGDSWGGQRWRRTLFTMSGPSGAAVLRPYGNYIARTWEEAHPGSRVEQVEIWFVIVRTLPDGEAPEERKKIATIPVRDHAETAARPR